MSLWLNYTVESILDKEDFTLEELLDEEDIIQECKALNSRLINFLRGRTQVEQLLHYIVEEAAEDADSKRAFKFPFISSEVFACEIDVILSTLVEDEELMNLLFSFLEPKRSHSVMLAGYFSKVVICLILRKTVPLMNYAKAHQNVFQQLVDLIGITAIMEVLTRLVGADDHVYPNHLDVMHWLADSNLLEMIVDKLNPLNTPEVNGNAAETLCMITQNAPSPLATKLSSPSFVARILGHALEDARSKSCLVHSLSVCISLLDPRRYAVSSPFMYTFRGHHLFESPISVNPETVAAMLPKLGELLALLNVSSDEKILPTTYGQLRPPLGSHRLKIVEFVTVLLKTAIEATEKELVTAGAIRRVLDLFFEYPYNNALHHHVESIIALCLDSKNDAIVDHLLQECDLIGKILQIEKQPILSGDNQPTLPTAGKPELRVGNIGHITRIANKLAQLSRSNSQIKTFLQENNEWIEWETNVLQDRNAVENVYRWSCGRPTTLHDRTRESDEDDIQDRSYDLAALSNNLNQFRYNMFENDGSEEGHGANGSVQEDTRLDDESDEVVISSLRLGDEQASNLFTNSNWFTFQEDGFSESTRITPLEETMEDVSLNEPTNGNNAGAEDGSMAETKYPDNVEQNLGFDAPRNEDLSSDNSSSTEWVTRGNSSSTVPVGETLTNPFVDEDEGRMSDLRIPNGGLTSSEGSSEIMSPRSPPVPSLFEEEVEFVGVEPEGTERAMEQALKEGIVGEAGPMKRTTTIPSPEKENSGEKKKEFNDTNYWRIDQEVTVVE
ncbi:PREDICTED: serine/threonine-protein phosphatase 6 regulatory subunit 3 isoform X2 [Tarenaya hassleriana]|uniref:serine/threonine-protein phosphatase 6 regulatory subunit 3 isoform X2 n=1 Tax=Tarenaya hassleriana TaxID=28532 RepID=UPI00053C4496|nr:PREDICTED: serine/threonine-protein phosphatase 6 regulatory subunit 3 isoform X2 [Tarenaya hassleriana]